MGTRMPMLLAVTTLLSWIAASSGGLSIFGRAILFFVKEPSATLNPICRTGLPASSAMTNYMSEILPICCKLLAMFLMVLELGSIQ